MGVFVQVVQAVQPAAMPGLREAYTQALNIVIRKQLRLYASDLRKAVAVHTASNPAEPDMGLAHKRVSLHGLHISLDCINGVLLHTSAVLNTATRKFNNHEFGLVMPWVVTLSSVNMHTILL